MLARIIEIVSITFLVRMGDDFSGSDPGTLRSIGLAVPNLAEYGCAQRLAGDHDIALAIFVPETRAAVKQYRRTGISVLQSKRRFFAFNFTRRDQFVLLTPRQRRCAL